MLAEPELRAEVERVAAAAGVRLVHAGDAAPVSRKTWTAAAAVVLDARAAARCERWALPRRDHVTVLTVGEPESTTWAAAVGADALLVDLDPWGGGIELLLGGENAPGLRWPDLALQAGRLTWSAVRDALPRHRGISVLSGTRRGYEVDAGPVHAIVEAGRRGAVTVICDLPRRLTDATQAALSAADLVVVVSRCDVRACAATTAMAPVLAASNPNVGLVVRGPSPGGLRAVEIAEIAGLPLLAAIKAQPQLGEQVERGGLRYRRRSALAVAAREVLGVLPPARAARNGRAA